jgi:hypothetical protein
MQCSQILLFQIIISRMSDSLSPSGSDLIIDDEDLDSVSVTKEDLSEAEAKCGLATGGRVIARPGLVSHSEKSTPLPKSTFKFGGVANVFPNIQSGPKVSSADPRTKYKPSGLLSLTNDSPPDNNNADNNFNIKRTVQNSSGSSSFIKHQQPDILNKSKFAFGSVSPSIGQGQTTSKKFTFGASSFSPQLSPTSPKAGDDDGQEDELKKYMQMREAQEAKMKAEKVKMERIEKLIERKKMEKQQQQQMWHFDYQGQQGGSFDKDIVAKKMELAKQEMELKNQTTMLLQMQQNMLMEKRHTEEERRKMEDQRKIMELQMSVKHLERLVTDKQAQGGSFQTQGSSSRPVRERLGRKSENGEGFGGREVEDREEIGRARKRRFMEGRSEVFDNDNQHGRGSNEGIKSCKKGKKSKYWCAKLPDDLVLTEITDQGPVKKEDIREAERSKRELVKQELEEYEDDLDRYEYEGELDPDLVLTEFGENGPVKAGSMDITSTSGK